MPVIPRNIGPVVLECAGQYPVVTLTGPRQSGKTTLCRALFPDKPYVTLEPLDVRDRVRGDPRGFLASVPDGAVIDEVQHVPELPSYLQVDVDEHRAPGRWVLTGSQHFGLTQAVTQSLAGRSAVLELLPLSFDELVRFPSPPADLMSTLLAGAWPAVHDRAMNPARWLADYFTTYVQRDVRQILNIGDLEAFTTFVRLCAGRTGQVVNLSAIGGDCGISHNTARAWMSVLEAAYLVFRLPAWYRNIRRQLVKAPKLHFVDVGLACHLLGIEESNQLVSHPLRGALFESWIASELYKSRAHRGRAPRMFHFRDHRGLEVDMVVEDPDAIRLVEVKAGETVFPDAFASLEKVTTAIEPSGAGRPIERFLAYGGAASTRWSDAQVVGWRDVARIGGGKDGPFGPPFEPEG